MRWDTLCLFPIHEFFGAVLFFAFIQRKHTSFKFIQSDGAAYVHSLIVFFPVTSLILNDFTLCTFTYATSDFDMKYWLSISKGLHWENLHSSRHYHLIPSSVGFHCCKWHAVLKNSLTEKWFSMYWMRFHWNGFQFSNHYFSRGLIPKPLL